MPDRTNPWLFLQICAAVAGREVLAYLEHARPMPLVAPSVAEVNALS